MASIQEQDLPGPDFLTIFNPLTCIRKGLCPVTQIRSRGDPFESHSLYFEQHGKGPEKIVFIMGLSNSSFTWAPQIDHFGHMSKYSSLVFDNRGIGYSGSPRGPYTTSGMAEDVVALLDYVDWKDKHSLHVVGVSFGGMIAQELATRIPERIISLSLIATTACGRPWTNLPQWKGVKSLIKFLTTTDPAARMPIILDMSFPSYWLEENAVNDPSGRTNREVQSETYTKRIELTRPQTLIGALSQMSAGFTHYVSTERLRTIASLIPKVLILTGDQDILVDPRNGIHLKSHMPQAEYIQWDKTGHDIASQWKDEFNGLLGRVFDEGRDIVTRRSGPLAE